MAHLATGGDDCCAKLWDLSALKPGEREALPRDASGWPVYGVPAKVIGSQTDAEGSHSGAVTSIAFSPGKGKLLATGSVDGTAMVTDLGFLGGQGKMVGHEAGVLSVSWSPDGSWLATCSADHSVRVWSINEKGFYSHSFVPLSKIQVRIGCLA